MMTGLNKLFLNWKTSLRLAGLATLASMTMLSVSCKHCEAPVQDTSTPKMTNEERVADARARRRDHYANLLARFLEDTPKQKPGGVVFLGDSITEGFPLEAAFPGKHVINRGISGDLVEGVIERLDVSVEDLHPSKVYVMIGINDLWWDTPVSMEVRKERYTRLLQGLKKAAPKAKIYIQSILPVGGHMPQVNENVLKVNAILQQLCKEEGLPYIDLHPWLGTANHEIRPEFTTDGVHLTLEGYEAWLEAILSPQENLETAMALSTKREDFHRSPYPFDRIDPGKEGEYPGSRGPNELVLYTPAYGHPSTGTNEWGSEAIIRNGRVEKTQAGGDASIPADGYVISGHGKAATWIGYNLKAGTRLEIKDKSAVLLSIPESEMTFNQRLAMLRDKIIDTAVRAKDKSPRTLRKCRSLLAQVTEIHRDPSLLTKEKLDRISAAVAALQ